MVCTGRILDEELEKMREKEKARRLKEEIMKRLELRLSTTIDDLATTKVYAADGKAVLKELLREKEISIAKYQYLCQKIDVCEMVCHTHHEFEGGHEDGGE